MKKSIQRLRIWMMEYAYLVTLGAIIAVIAASALYTQRLRSETESGVQAAAGAPEVMALPTATASAGSTALPTIAPLTFRTMELKRSSVWPVDGDVIRPFDALEPVYWETLNCWQTHTALDIVGEAGESVRCAAAGEVVSASRDELWGWQVSVMQADGRMAQYAGLATCAASAGQEVALGQAIGTLLERIPCEAELPAHLHFVLLRDGKAQDPQGMLPER